MLKRIHFKELYMRIFFIIGLVFVGMALLYSLFLTNQISKYAINEVNGSTAVKLNHFKSTMEITLRKLKVSSIQLYQDRNIGYWLTATSKDSYLNHLVDLKIGEFLSTERLIQDVYLFNLSSREVFSAKSGPVPFDNFPDQAMLQQVVNQTMQPLNFSKVTFMGQTELTLSLPNGGIDQTPNGRLMIILDKTFLAEDLLLSNNEFEGKWFVVDKDQNVLMGDVRASNAGDIIHAGNQWRSDGQDWGVQSITFSDEVWQLFLLSPQGIWKNKLLILNFKVLGSFFLMIALLLVVLYFLSKQNYKPLTEILGKIRIYTTGLKLPENTLSISSFHTEFKLGIDTLVHRIEEQNRSLKNNDSIVKDELLRQWILSDAVGPSLREDLQQKLTIRLNKPIRLAVCRIEDYTAFCQTYNFQSRKLLKFAIQNVIEEVLRTYGLKAETSDLGSDHVVIVLSVPDTQKLSEPDLLAILVDTKHHVLQWIKVAISIGISDPIDSAENIHHIYRMTYELTEISFITGESAIYTPQDRKETYIKASFDGLDTEQITAFIQSIRIRDTDALQRQLQHLFNQLQDLPAEESKLQLIQLLYVFQKSFKQLNTPGGMVGIRNQLDQFNNLKEVHLWVEETLMNLIEQMSNRRTQKEDIFPEIVEYISNHLHDAMLTIDDIANHVNFSVNYLRVIFKEQNDISISDFILERRIEKVKELLLKTKWSIAEISSQSGFQSKSHFFTAFKKGTGMTPSQYRDEHTQP
ncbi:helix-turn-helix domain-containing protein [Paenibacillus qinlingensis]|uniref:helix-turn-helix domain-containing protein n=1 Tax=Paenibacillus qinlingensis TaxID=1837343 RepID=UPI00156780C1|nr:AraC family transcriptional regulator [Paenibacillus qinlingensis]NQX63320.1 helix-turn-helix transcriptional regulator [Paenibacillus qinlingensis]